MEAACREPIAAGAHLEAASTEEAAAEAARCNEEREKEELLWLAYRCAGDPKERLRRRNELVALHGPWAVAQARVFANVRRLEWRSVWGAAALGLIEAVERFDPGRGVPFKVYAYPRIQAARMDAARPACGGRARLPGDAAESEGAGDTPVASPASPRSPNRADPTRIAAEREIVSRLLACFPEARTREIAERRLLKGQSVDEIGLCVDLAKSRVEDIVRYDILPRARREMFKLGLRAPRLRRERPGGEGGGPSKAQEPPPEPGG